MRQELVLADVGVLRPGRVRCHRAGAAVVGAGTPPCRWTRPTPSAAAHAAWQRLAASRSPRSAEAWSRRLVPGTYGSGNAPHAVSADERAQCSCCARSRDDGLAGGCAGSVRVWIDSGCGTDRFGHDPAGRRGRAVRPVPAALRRACRPRADPGLATRRTRSAADHLHRARGPDLAGLATTVTVRASSAAGLLLAAARPVRDPQRRAAAAAHCCRPSARPPLPPGPPACPFRPNPPTPPRSSSTAPAASTPVRGIEASSCPSTRTAPDPQEDLAARHERTPDALLVDELLAQDVCAPAVLGESAQHVEVYPAQRERAAPVAVDQVVEP